MQGVFHAIIGSVLVATTALIFGGVVADYAVLLWSIAMTIGIWRSLRQRGFARNHPLTSLGWTAALIVVGFVVRGIHGELTNQVAPIPSPADLIHIPAYLCFLATITRLHLTRSRRRSTDAWLDALIIALAFFVTVWSVFLGDFILNSGLPVDLLVVNSVYTTIIFISLVVFLRASATPGVRPLSYFLLGGAAISFMVVDLAATYSLTRGTGLSLTITLSPFVFGLARAAVGHESVERLLDRTSDVELRLGFIRLGVIALAIAAPTTVVFFQPPDDQIFRTVTTIALVSLAAVVTGRVIRLLSTQQKTADLERQLSLEISRLAALGSSAEVASALPAAISRLLPNVRRVPNNGQQDSDLWPIPIPGNVASGFGGNLSVPSNSVDQRDRRLVTSLVREAGVLATVNDSLVDRAKEKSNAEAARQIAINEQRFRALVQNSSDLVLVIDDDASITYMSEASQRILGREADGCVGLDVRELLIQGDVSDANRYVAAVLNDSPPAQDLEVRLLHSDGSTRLFECAFTDMFNVEGVNGLVINATDVTNQRTLERDLLNAATTDPLTLMLNRSAFINEISSAMRSASLTGAGVSVAIINIDNFRQLNESLGPVLADQVLINSSHAIRRSVRLADSVARLSGGEFAVLFPTVSEASEAAALVERVLEELAIPMSVGEKELEITARAGISTGGDTTLDGPALVRQADTALDTARRNADHRVVLYEEEMGEAASERIDIRDRLNESIDNGELRLVYQPIVDFATGDIVSMESLARWEHPERGNIPPDVFIPIAESSGYIDKLGDWALETACLQLIEWNDLGLVGLTISVNMSAHQIRANDIVDRVQSILRRTGVDPTSVVVEITESVLIDDTDFIASRINALRSLGLGLAIDDFGTGYSSLSYLQRYAFDILKIDRSFVTDLDQAKNARRAEVVRSIVSLAKGLGALTVAEGVEEESERRELKKLGCDRAQGFLFYTPVEASEVPAILAAKSVSLRAA